MLENKVYIYNFADLKLIDQIDTYVNPTGLCAVNATKDDMVMACLGEGLGEVRVDHYSRNQARSPFSHHNILYLNILDTNYCGAHERHLATLP